MPQMAPTGWSMLLVMIVGFVICSGCMCVGVVDRPVPPSKLTQTSFLWSW